MFEKFGIYGMHKVEGALLASLVTGDPALLVGSHGTAKTALCKKLAQALDLSFIAYDASKAMFEDLIGFPSPSSLSEGKMDYVPTPISIWGKGFVLVDELSRAAPSMQNKWLEVIRSRQVMGKPIEGLRHIVAAMNPPTYAGAHPLDEALAGRFATVVRIPEVSEMEEGDVLAILGNLTGDDAPLLPRARVEEVPSPQPSLWTEAGAKGPAGGSDLGAFVEEARARYLEQGEDLLEPLRLYVAEVATLLRQRELGPDGRRMGMMFRTLRAGVAVFCTKERASAPSGALLDVVLGGALPHTLPFQALGKEFQEAALAAVHRTAFAAAFRGARTVHILLPPDPLRALRNFRRDHAGASRDEVKGAVSEILGRTKRPDVPRAAALAAVGGLASSVCAGEVKVEPEEQARILEAYRDMTEIRPRQAHLSFAGACDLMRRGGEEPSESVALRVAFAELTEDGDCPNREDLARLEQEVSEVLGAACPRAEEVPR